MISIRNLVFTLVIVFITHQYTWALIGDPCTSSCDGGMACFDGKCACPTGSVETSDRKRCVEVATTLGGGCEMQTQCTLKFSDYSQCLDNKCSCKENAIAVNNVCEKKRELTESCTSPDQCQHIKDATCLSNVCACKEQFVPHSTNRTACLPLAVGFQSTCEEDIQCSKTLGDKAFCRDTTCQCMEGHHAYRHPFESKCLENKGLKETCSAGQCYLPMDQDNQNIDCFENICACKNDVQPSDDDQSCSGSAGLQSLGLLTALWFVALGMSRDLL